MCVCECVCVRVRKVPIPVPTYKDIRQFHSVGNECFTFPFVSLSLNTSCLLVICCCCSSEWGLIDLFYGQWSSFFFTRPWRSPRFEMGGEGLNHLCLDFQIHCKYSLWQTVNLKEQELPNGYLRISREMERKINNAKNRSTLFVVSTYNYVLVTRSITSLVAP